MTKAATGWLTTGTSPRSVPSQGIELGNRVRLPRQRGTVMATVPPRVAGILKVVDLVFDNQFDFVAIALEFGCVHGVATSRQGAEATRNLGTHTIGNTV